MALMLLAGGGAMLAVAADKEVHDPEFAQASLQQLNRALARLKPTGSLTTQVALSSAHNAGEDEDMISRTGRAWATVKDSDKGLSLNYSSELLQQMTLETQQRAADADAATPALDGVDELTLANVQPMLRAAAAIRQELQTAEYLGAEEDTYQGNRARRLEFTLSDERLTKRQRKYVKDYDGAYTVWTDEQGNPLASRTRMSARGRAFIVISFTITIESDSHYRVHDGRLITTRRADYQLSSGAGERSERLVNKTLEVIDE
ncbi:hypothetical protein [Gilvimarinus agarilyticus]|uniref:hypothetical protein n=1 Tax=Gilvimarinus agarilyticus TaxID=679259 RepID=UPI0005A1E586|nr:hypothetical protein [Gilvimarinus agarilyticus]